jgi:hypothetical protein
LTEKVFKESSVNQALSLTYQQPTTLNLMDGFSLLYHILNLSLSTAAPSLQL